jgi:hypothetical protein
MAATEALKETPETPEAGAERERSTIGFPYNDLDDAVSVTKGVHAVGGSSCQWDQLAGHFNQAANGGGFRLRLLTAKMFGFLTYDKGSVTLTPLGTRVCDPKQERAARVEGFLTVPLYNKVYEQFKGGTLPPVAGLESAMVTLGVAPKQKDKARQVFQRSARQAEFFAYGADRLVMPSIKPGAATGQEIEDNHDGDEEIEEKRKRGGNGGGKSRHPLIEGLIKTLPEAETQWDLQGRRKWLLAASNIFDLIYTDSDESKGTLKIEVEKNSAK